MGIDGSYILELQEHLVIKMANIAVDFMDANPNDKIVVELLRQITDQTYIKPRLTPRSPILPEEYDIPRTLIVEYDD